MVKFTIYGDRLYTISDLSKASDLSASVIRRWIANGDLKYFITVYNNGDKKNFYKLGLPYSDDELLGDSSYIYKLREGKIYEINKTTRRI